MITELTHTLSEQMDLMTVHLCDALDLPTPVKSALRGGLCVTVDTGLFESRLRDVMRVEYGVEDALGDDLQALVLDFHRAVISTSPHWTWALTQGATPEEVVGALQLPVKLRAVLRADVTLPQALSDEVVLRGFQQLVLRLEQDECTDTEASRWLSAVRGGELLTLNDASSLYQVLRAVTGDRSGNGIHLLDLLWWLWISLHITSHIQTYFRRAAPNPLSLKTVLSPVLETLTLYLQLSGGLVIKSARDTSPGDFHPLDLILEPPCKM